MGLSCSRRAIKPAVVATLAALDGRHGWQPMQPMATDGNGWQWMATAATSRSASAAVLNESLENSFSELRQLYCELVMRCLSDNTCFCIGSQFIRREPQRRHS